MTNTSRKLINPALEHLVRQWWGRSVARTTIFSRQEVPSSVLKNERHCKLARSFRPSTTSKINGLPVAALASQRLSRSFQRLSSKVPVSFANKRGSTVSTVSALVSSSLIAVNARPGPLSNQRQPKSFLFLPRRAPRPELESLSYPTIRRIACSTRFDESLGRRGF